MQEALNDGAFAGLEHDVLHTLTLTGAASGVILVECGNEVSGKWRDEVHG